MIVAFLFSETVCHGRAFVGDSDRLVHEIPSSLLLAEAERAGEPPFWNPYSFCGALALGDAQIFSGNVIHVFLARCFGDVLPLAISWRFIVEALSALVASYFLFLPLSPHPLAAMVSALVLPLSMGALEHLNHGTPAYTDIAFFPVVLLLLRDAAARSAPANIALLAGVFYLQLTGGMYHLNLYFVPFYFGYAVWAVRREGGRPFHDVLSLWFQMGLALALVGGAGASQFVALWQASGDSNRVAWPYERVRDEFGQPWFAVFRLFLPFLYGNGLSFPWATFGPHTNEFETLPVYPGMVPLFLAAFALRSIHRRWVWGWWGGVVFLVLASLRTDAVAIPYFLYLGKPLQHSRLCILVPVCIAFLAPFGARLLLSADGAVRRRWAAWILAAGAVAIGAAQEPALGMWTGWLGDGFLDRFNQPPNVISSFCHGRPSLSDTLPRFPELARAALLHAGVALMAIGAILFLWAFRRISATGLLAGCLALSVLDVLWVGRSTLVPFARSSRDVYPENAVTRFLKAAPDRDDYRVSFDQYIRWPGAGATGDRFGYNIHAPHGIRSDGGKANFIDARYARLLALAVEEGDDEIFQVPERATRDPYFADLFATRYFVVHDDPENRDRYSAFCDLALVEDGVLVYRKREALARYRLLSGYDLVLSGEEAFGRLRGKTVPLDRRALLEKGPPPPFPAREGAAAGTIVIERETLNAVEGTIDLPEPAILLAVNTWDAGWKAFLDDAPVPLYLANGAFQAIACPAGRHRFRIACEDRTPGTFAITRWAAAGLWGGVVVWGIIGWRRRRVAP